MKVLFLGIDALDSLLLERFSAELPNFTEFRSNNFFRPVRSTFPPDSDTAWTTIVSGLNPAQHGIVHFVDPLEKSYQLLNIGSKNDVFKGKTFWDLISNAGFKAHAIFPHLSYPVWDTPGIMVARASTVKEVQANYPDVLLDYPDPDSILGVRGLPDPGISALQDYASRLTRQLDADVEFTLKIMRKHSWDLLFAYFSTIDLIGHSFWNFYDPEDPNYTKGHPLERVILNTYKHYDQVLGRFLAEVDDDVTVMVLSDHGHGARPYKLISVNEILRQSGFLIAANLKKKPHLYAFEKLKRLGIQVVSRYGLGKLASKMVRLFPGTVKTFTRPPSIDWNRTIAYATDMSGVKAYSYGGIMINRSGLGNREYDNVRSQIIHEVSRACILPDGTNVLKWIAPREERYQGPHLNKYPDILLELIYGFGVGWSINEPLLTTAASYNLVPGSHRGETGVFLLRSSRPVYTDIVDLQDITPSLLDLFSVDRPENFNFYGRSIFSPRISE